MLRKLRKLHRKNSLYEAVTRVKEADLASPSPTLLLAKQALRGSFVKPKWARKVALQGVGADLFASVGCRSAVKLWSLSGVHRIAKLSLRGSFVKPKWARKVALQGVGADLFASVGCRSA